MGWATPRSGRWHTHTPPAPAAATLRKRRRRTGSASALSSPATAAHRSAGSGGWHDDVHGSPEWRAAMTHRLGEEIVAELLPDSPGARTIHGRVTGDLSLMGDRS